MKKTIEMMNAELKVNEAKLALDEYKAESQQKIAELKAALDQYKVEANQQIAALKAKYEAAKLERQELKNDALKEEIAIREEWGGITPPEESPEASAAVTTEAEPVTVPEADHPGSDRDAKIDASGKQDDFFNHNNPSDFNPVALDIEAETSDCPDREKDDIEAMNAEKKVSPKDKGFNPFLNPKYKDKLPA